MKKKNIFRIIILLLASHTISAQKVWTLADCINYANENNIQIKQTELGVDLNEGNLKQSKAALLPKFSAGASNVYNFGRTIDPFTNQFATERVRSNNFYLQSSVVLFSGFQNINAMRQANYEYLASKLNVDKMRNDISLSISLAYLQILYNKELVEIAKNQAEVTKGQINRTEKLVNAGKLAKGSLLDIQSQAATEELQLVNAMNQLDLSILNLKQLLDLNSQEAFDIVKPTIDPKENMLSGTTTDIYNTAVAAQPEIKSAEYKVQSALAGYSIAKGAVLPSLQLSGSYGTGYSGASKVLDNVGYSGMDTIGITTTGERVIAPRMDYNYKLKGFDAQIKDNLNKSIGIYLTIPIFNGLQVRNNMNRARINKLNAEYNLLLAQKQLQKSIEQAYADALAALKKYQATTKSVSALKESFRYVQQKFEVGMVNTIDFNVSKNNLAKAESELLQAKYDYVFRVKVLDFYQGKAIVLE